jgi:hypothetical protein
MAEDLTISGPIEIDGKHRVAWDMARYIAGEEKNPQRASDPRKYFLALYYQCYHVLTGGLP